MTHPTQKIAYTIVPSPEHNLMGHPENPTRFTNFHQLIDLPFSDTLVPVEAKPLDNKILELVHPKSYQKAIQASVANGPSFLDYGDTYATPQSPEAASLSAGGLIQVIDTILDGYAHRGFALIRPPGHHATATQAMGFCIFNNVAIAARYLQQKGLQRVMIVDFDVHHGNGTQDIFYHDADVLYVSTHQWGIYPGTGYLREIGEGNGEGTTINIPLPARAGDESFQIIFAELIRPAANRFSPDALLVSAGFDAHWSDPLASLQLTTLGYQRIAAELVQIAGEHCQDRVIFTLEGGYDPEALAENVFATFYSLADQVLESDPLGAPPFTEALPADVISQVAEIHNL